MQRSFPAQSQPVLSRKSKISELEENLFSKLDNLFIDQPKKEQVQTLQPKVDLLEQAKQRIQQKKEANPSFFEEGRKKLAAQRKKDTFLITAVNSIPQKQQYKKQSQTSEYYKEETDCNNMLKDLIAQEERPYDDLAELRRMIAQTEQCMVEYVDDMYKNYQLGISQTRMSQNIIMKQKKQEWVLMLNYLISQIINATNIQLSQRLLQSLRIKNIELLQHIKQIIISLINVQIILYQYFIIHSCLCNIIITVQCRIPYQKVRPIIAAHRGLSSLYPENTLEGFRSALQFSDFIELDVVLNKDRLPIVCHDTFLSLVSDVKKHYKFENRKQSRILYDKVKLDWWISDFTFEELKELRLSQCINNRKSEYDGHLKIPSLKETVEYFLKYNQNIDNKKGILLEIKDYDYHQQYCNINIAEIILTFLKEQGLSTLRECSQKLPIVIMSFEKQILQYFNNYTDLPLTQLVCFEDKNIPTITEIAQYAKIIGLDLRLVWENNQTHQYYNEAKENGLTIYGWTFQDDSDDLKRLFNEQDVGKIYQKSSTLLQGIITEFPQEAVKFIL